MAQAGMQSFAFNLPTLAKTNAPLDPQVGPEILELMHGASPRQARLIFRPRDRQRCLGATGVHQQSRHSTRASAGHQWKGTAEGWF